jgi:hypothetical protein
VVMNVSIDEGLGTLLVGMEWWRYPGREYKTKRGQQVGR